MTAYKVSIKILAVKHIYTVHFSNPKKLLSLTVILSLSLFIVSTASAAQPISTTITTPDISEPFPTQSLMNFVNAFNGASAQLITTGREHYHVTVGYKTADFFFDEHTTSGNTLYIYPDEFLNALGIGNSCDSSTKITITSTQATIYNIATGATVSLILGEIQESIPLWASYAIGALTSGATNVIPIGIKAGTYYTQYYDVTVPYTLAGINWTQADVLEVREGPTSSTAFLLSNVDNNVKKSDSSTKLSA